MKIELTTTRAEDIIECDSYEIKDGFFQMKIGNSIESINTSQLHFFRIIGEEKKTTKKVK